MASYLVTAAVGMLFWVAAARSIPPVELGVQTALVSLVTAIGTVTAYGTGSAFKAMLPVPGCARYDRLTDGVLLTLALSLVIGFAAAAVGRDSLPTVSGVMMLVPIGSAVIALFVLKDAALIGLHTARWLPAINLAAVTMKVVLVLVLAHVVSLAAVWATLVPAGLAVVVLATLLGRAMRQPADGRVRCAPEDKRLSRKALVGFTWRDGTASCTTFGLILILPFLTTWLAGPVQGAMVAMALAVAQALDFVPDGMGAALTAHFASSPSGINIRIRRMWALATAIVAVGAAGLAVCGPVIGWIFGEAYRTGEFRWCLSLLALSCLLRVPYSLWIAILRATMATKTLLRFNIAAAVFTLPVVVVLTDRHGSVGAAAGLCVASVVLGVAGSWDLCRRWCRG